MRIDIIDCGVGRFLVPICNKLGIGLGNAVFVEHGSYTSQIVGIDRTSDAPTQGGFGLEEVTLREFEDGQREVGKCTRYSRVFSVLVVVVARGKLDSGGDTHDGRIGSHCDFSVFVADITAVLVE